MRLRAKRNVNVAPDRGWVRNIFHNIRYTIIGIVMADKRVVMKMPVEASFSSPPYSRASIAEAAAEGIAAAMTIT